MVAATCIAATLEKRRPLPVDLLVPEPIFASTHAMIGFGAAAFGKRFRLYSIATIVVLLFFGGLTFLEALRLQANLPTPWIGLWERINISMFLLWVVILAALLWRNGPRQAVGDAS